MNAGGDQAGGGERSLSPLIRGLSDRGHSVGIITLMEGDAAQAFAADGATVLANGVPRDLGGARRHSSAAAFIVATARMAPAVASTAMRVRRLAKAWVADIIHTNGLRAHALTPFVAVHGRRVVWSLGESPPGGAQQRLVRESSRYASAVLAPSAFAASVVARHGPVVYMLPSPVELGVVLDRQSARTSLGLPGERCTAGVIAHLHPTKGHHVAVEAWQHLEPPRPLLVLAGGELYGPESARYRNDLLRQIDRLGLQEDVRLVGLVHHMQQFYAAFDMIIHPALHPEGFGRSMAEAQLAGIPVIATAIGAATELITDGHSGLLVPPGDVASLADAVARIVASRALSSHLGVGGRAVADRYDVGRHVSAVEAVYEALASR